MSSGSRFLEGPGAPLLLALFVAVVYANALSADFVWDDLDLIVNNALFQTRGGFLEIFRTDPFGYPLSLGQYYRPIQTLTFWVQYQLHGGETMPYHAFNVVLHLIDVVLAFYLLVRLGVGRLGSFLVALAFGVHPVTVECVTFVAVRGDLLLFFFTLLVLHSFLGLESSSGWRRAARIGFLTLAMLLALLTKESAVVVPVLLGLTAWQVRPLRRAQVATVGLAVAMTLTYVGIRAFAHLSKVAPETLSNIAYATPVERLLTVPRILFTDVRLLLLPHSLHIEYQFVESSWSSPYVWLGGPLALLFLGFLGWSARRRNPRLALYFLAWFVVGIGPFLQIVPLAQTLAERWLYLPGFGFLALLLLAVEGWVRRPENASARVSSPDRPREAVATESGRRGQYIALALGVLWIAFLGTQTHLRNRDWQTAEQLFGGDLLLAGESFLVPHNYGVTLLRRGEHDRARELFELSIERAPGPGYGTAHNSLGSALEVSGDLVGAEREFAKAIRLSRHPLAFSNRGRVLLRLGRSEEARRTLEDGLRSYPHHADLYYYLGYAHGAAENWQGAIAAWERVPGGAPGFEDVPALLDEARRRATAPE